MVLAKFEARVLPVKLLLYKKRVYIPCPEKHVLEKGRVNKLVKNHLEHKRQEGCTPS